MEKKNAMQIIASRKLISSPGKYTVKVTNVTPFHKDLGEGGEQVAIANFNAMTGYHLSAAKDFLAQGEYQEATNQNLSHSIRSNDYQPSKGEYVDIIVEKITTKNDVTGLFVTSLTPVKASEAGSISIESLEGGSEERVAVETEEEAAA